MKILFKFKQIKERLSDVKFEFMSPQTQSRKGNIIKPELFHNSNGGQR
ncbi:MAG: hypothetical protein WCY25_02610 [Moheibacter sp.]